MNHSSANRKTSQRDKTAETSPSAGPDGISVTPPAYGIESVERVSAETVPVAEKQPIAGTPTQMKADLSAAGGDDRAGPASGRNRTGLPDALKSGVESLSGLSLDDVRVHFNSPKPAQLQALAYAQGTDIHVGPGQERHLPHEAWHVVQQKQGRVKVATQMKAVRINDDVHLEREADVMGGKATRCIQPMEFKQEPVSGTNTTVFPIQRKIGAEIEVPGVFLTYDRQQPASQGETVGRIVPGIITEIHLEGPKDGVATFEFATGLHGQYPPEHPLSLAFQVGYLATWIEIAKLKGRTYLKDMPLVALDDNWRAVNQNNGPLLDVDNGIANAGAFQINVSPTAETASTFQDVFDNMNSVTHDHGTLTEQALAVNMALRNSKTFALGLYGNIIELLEAEIDDSVPGILKSVIKALTTVPRVLYFNYLKGLEGFDSPTKDIIDKNILDLLPRANLQELWEKALASDVVTSLDANIGQVFPGVLRQALGQTAFPSLAEGWVIGDDFGEGDAILEALQRQNRLVNDRGNLAMEEWMRQLQEVAEQIKVYEFLGQVAKGPSLMHTMDLRAEAYTEMLAVLSGEKILVKNRKVKTPQAPSILGRTDSSLLPVSEEEGLAGVFEIRNPFTHMVPLSDWKKAVAAYEEMLAKKSVRY